MKNRQLCVGLLLCTITLVVYLPVRGFGFVNYDDGAYVTENPNVMAGLTSQQVAWAFSWDSCEPSGNWHPLAWLSLMADVSLFGIDPGAMHLVNLLLHLLNVLLLFLLLQRLTQQFWASAFVAAVFAVHPLHVESVAWISERKDVLSTFFVLLTMLAHLRYVGSGLKRWQFISLVLFMLSLMSKQMYVTLPFVLLLLDYWPLGRLSLAPEPRADMKTLPLRMLLIEKLPYLLVTVLFSVVAFLGQRHRGAVGSLEEYSILQRCLNALVSYAEYLWQTIWPFGLAVFYAYPQELPWAKATVALIVLAGITVIALKWHARHPHIIVGWLWYLGTLVPVIGLVQIGRQRMADRYMYFPMIGLLIAVSWSVVKWAAGHPRRIDALRVMGIVIVIGLLLAGRIQTSYWSDSTTLFTHAAEVAESSLAHTKLGYDAAHQGRLDVALIHFHRALELDPDYIAAHTSLGNTYLAKGQPQQAIRPFQRAIEIDPTHSEAQYNLGIAHSLVGNWTQAVDHFELALGVDAGNASVHANLGIACQMLGHDLLAIEHLERAIELNPELVQAHFALGQLLASRGQDREAIQQFETVLRLQPGTPAVHSQLAQLYKQQGDTPRATLHRRLADDKSSPSEAAHADEQ